MQLISNSEWEREAQFCKLRWHDSGEMVQRHQILSSGGPRWLKLKIISITFLPECESIEKSAWFLDICGVVNQPSRCPSPLKISTRKKEFWRFWRVIVAVWWTENPNSVGKALFCYVAIVIDMPAHAIILSSSWSSCHLDCTVEKNISSCIENKEWFISVCWFC
jgi:hypothetical protein